MDSSSGEESFTWEKASYGSDDSDEPSKLDDDSNKNKFKIKHDKSSHNVEDANNIEYEPKARKKRKHNIEENSFQQEECPKRKKIKTEPESDSEAKKKIKKKVELSNNNGYSYNLSDSEQQENDEYLNMQVKQEQKYLELSNNVKYEKNKKHRDNEFENVDSKESNVNDNTSKKKKNKKKKKHTNHELSMDSATENDICNHENQEDNIVQETYELSKKSPKKKKRKERLPSYSYDSPENENKFSAEETKVQNNKTSDYNINEAIQSDHSSDLNSSMGLNDTKYSQKQYQNNINTQSSVRNTQTRNDSPRKKTSTKQICPDYQNNVAAIDDKSNSADYNDEENGSYSNNDLDDSTYNNHSKSLKKQFLNGTNNESPIKITNNSPETLSSKQSIDFHNNVSITKPGRLKDRLCYEDDPDTDIDVTQSNNDTSTYLKKYLKQNNNLQPIVKGLQKGSEITDDDELWILKCPHDIDILKLDNTSFNLDNKSKIKIHGETYCGNLDENTSTIAILSSDDCNFIIKNVVASGTINLRKRLPKPHVQEDNIMINNQTDFIPLPETKCRHPLFGSDYKDAIHVRTRERGRVHSAEHPEASTVYERNKKKKRKKDHYTTFKQELDNSLETSPKLENEADVTKKAKKRKHVTEDESYKKKSKRIKLEPDSAEAWESEKAIEENLFNF